MTLFWDKFLLFGDSLTQFSFDQDLGFGFGAGLQSTYIRKLDVVDRGFSGYNTRHGKLILPHILDAEHKVSPSDTKIMTIFLGTNDALNTFQHVPLEEYIENMTSMINLVKEKNISLMVILPGLHDQSLAIKEMGLDKPSACNKTNKLYADALQDLCEKLKVPFIHFWKVQQKAIGKSEEELVANSVDLSKLLTDGVHYTPTSYQLLYHEVLNTVKSNYPSLYPDNLKLILPEYSELDSDKYEQIILNRIEDKNVN